jgi:tellurite resistance protein TerC
MIGKFRYLKVSLALVLILVGAKMLAASWLKKALGANFNFYLLGLVFLVLAVGVAASLLVGRKAGVARSPVPGGNRAPPSAFSREKRSKPGNVGE